jgi:hypothetical protein
MDADFESTGAAVGIISDGGGHVGRGRDAVAREGVMFERDIEADARARRET